MKTWQRKLMVASGFLAVVSIVILGMTGQSESIEQPKKTFYYSFEKKIYGRLDTSILAVQIPKGMKLTELSAPLDAVKGKFISEEVPYVKAFQQEKIAFVQLDRPVDTGRFFQLLSMFLSVSPTARVGHPFFVEGEKLPLIVTNEFVVRFKPDVEEERITEYNRSQKVEMVKKNPHVDNQYLLRPTEDSALNALGMANRYRESGLVVFAHPNFLLHIEYYHVPSDPNFSNQWHLNNLGSLSMKADADIDAVEAWDITRGDPDIVIAVIDGGFQIKHSDLKDNFVINNAELRNGADDDGNGYIDDINGWSFVGDSDDVSIGLWPYHGQSVAGLVAAEENGTKTVGVCPRCRLLFIANTFDIDNLANAFYYARDRDADIITNSWGHTGTLFEQPILITAIDETANGTRGGRGIPIFFATGNDGGSVVAYPARDPNTIAIGGSDCKDVKYEDSQYGPEISVVSPTRQVDGSCGLVTTGLNNGITPDFGGTSGATPIAAAIAGLMLSVNPNLTRHQVQQILQETAKKIEPAVANYDTNGFSNTHGYGRVNAHRAVQTAIPKVFQYAAKIVCGSQKDPNTMRLARGFYATAINIHNPNNMGVKLSKNLALTFPPEEQKAGEVIPIGKDELGPFQALEVDCEDIRGGLFEDECGFSANYIKGFVVIHSPKSLDVTAVYSTASLEESKCGQFKVGSHTSIDVEQIRERVVRPKKSPDLIVKDINSDALHVDCSRRKEACVTTVSFTVSNVGAGNAGAFNIRIVLDPKQSVIVHHPVIGLAAGASRVFTIKGPPSGNCFDPDCTVCVTVDSDDTVLESNEMNNKRCETKEG